MVPGFWVKGSHESHRAGLGPLLMGEPSKVVLESEVSGEGESLESLEVELEE